MSKTYVFFNSFFRLFSKIFLAEIRHFLILRIKNCNYVENVRFRHNVNNGISGVEWGRKMNKNANFISKLKKIVFYLSIICCCFGTAIAQTETITWTVDGQTYATTSCESGDDIVLPNPPTKNGFTFAGWKGYTPVEYLQSTGTQYIDTGFVPKAGTKMEVRVLFLSGSLFAASVDNSIGGLGYFGGGQYHGGFLFYFNSYHVTNASINNSDILTVSLEVDELNTRATINFNNETKQQNYTFTQNGNLNSSATIGLFAVHALSNTYVYSWPEFSSIEMFYTKIWDNGVLVRDMIPVLDEAGVACMFDRVTNQFFYNAGTGNFIAGPIVTE